MKRLLFAGSKTCPSGCIYCFARMQSYQEHGAQSMSTPPNLGDAEVWYPCCDSEFSRTPKFVSLLAEASTSRPHTIISLSTKSALPEDFLQHIAALDASLRERNAGFVKLGVSLSTKLGIDEIERRTTDYCTRLRTVEAIVSKGIACSINLKPILPFVPSDEYCQIVDDTASFEVPYLIGGLYVDRKSQFFDAYIANKYPITMRCVDWLPHLPSWAYVPSNATVSIVKSHIADKGGNVFDSDPELLAKLKPQTVVCA